MSAPSDRHDQDHADLVHLNALRALARQERETARARIAACAGCRRELEALQPGHRVGMLVRLAPGIAYPPHRRADLEELHLLEGELMIGDRKLVPGDHNRAEPGTIDLRVGSETGCTCVLIHVRPGRPAVAARPGPEVLPPAPARAPAAPSRLSAAAARGSRAHLGPRGGWDPTGGVFFLAAPRRPW
jgi:hypothetical protein